MGELRKQHYVPKTYLNHFTDSGKGIDIFIHYGQHKYKKKVEKKNAGDSVFWKKNFYDVVELDDRKELEKIFSRESESQYSDLMLHIARGKEINDWSVKERILSWIILLKLRSVAWREKTRQELLNVGIAHEFESAELREEHLKVFTDEGLLGKVLSYYVQRSISKVWSILRSPMNNTWITSDNPGFSINLNGHDHDFSNIHPNPYCTNIASDAVLYFPLTKDYCLEIGPYPNDTPLSENLSNSPIVRRTATPSEVNCINYWTYITQYEFAISSNADNLRPFEKMRSAQP